MVVGGGVVVVWWVVGGGVAVVIARASVTCRPIVGPEAAGKDHVSIRYSGGAELLPACQNAMTSSGERPSA